MRPLVSLIISALGISFVVLFYLDIYVPIGVSVVTYTVGSIYMFYMFTIRKLGIATMFMWAAFMLPFIHIIPYMWFDFMIDNPALMWGLALRPYMLDQQIVVLTAMIGAVGAIGFIVGATLSSGKLNTTNNFSSYVEYEMCQTNTLSIVSFMLWVAIGVVLSWISAPQETLFVSEYAESVSIIEESNFSSAWMMSYSILIYALADAIMDRSEIRRKIKKRIILSCVVFVLIWLQFLRGDRAAIPFVISAAFMYYHWGKERFSGKAFSHKANLGMGRKYALWLLSFTTLVLILVSNIIGVVRHNLVGVTSFSEIWSIICIFYEAGVLKLSNLTHGTWSAVLLTPLSVAGDHVSKTLPMLYGQTYLDIVLSLPPGFIADAIGYQRPFDISEPAKMMTYGLGGTHATVVPFMNFRMLGVFIVPAIWANLLVKAEKRSVRKFNTVNFSLLGIIVMASPHFVWYGEKYGINAIVIWLVLSIFYKNCIGSSSYKPISKKLSISKEST